MKLNRAVITGIGCVSPLGRDVPALIDGLTAGRSAARYMAAFEQYTGLRSLIAAPAELVDEKLIPRKDRRSMSRMSIFSVQAAEQALADACLAPADMVPGDIGCVIGSTIGSMNTMAETFDAMLPEYDLNQMTSMQFFQVISHTAVMNVAQYLGITGAVLAPSAACASGLQAVGIAYDLVRLGRQKAVLCGGTEELHPTVTGSFDVLYAASTGYNDNPAKASRPFDRDRDGLVCGDGSGILLVEEYEHAKARNARIYAEIAGFETCGSGEHISQSSRGAMIQCMGRALQQAGLQTDDIDYINAHATSTVHGDKEEAAAIRDIFADTVPVSSMKGNIGHTLGASGAIELIISLVMMKQSAIFPTLNLEHIDPECGAIDHVVETREQPIRNFLKNAFAFGGINTTLICSRSGDGV
ncbi:MAG: beta-ketoacyl-[acyl-carrier-protein] synthase family protein [Spartobacteria bacterium]|nr:beta-ketoacyl-[acyl-carrier-protein] synthase family protein [Spartobacteria bacterium]